MQHDDNALSLYSSQLMYTEAMVFETLFNIEGIALLAGSIAAASTTVAFIPQVVHTFQSRDVSGISLGMYSVFTFGVFMWLVYGLMLKSWPMIIANTITLLLALSILLMKLKYHQ